MFKYFFCLCFFVVSSSSMAQTGSPEEGWILVKKESKDLDGDRKEDEIFWLTQSKAKNARPERLLMKINGKNVLDYKTTFCGPSGQNGYGNAEQCKTIELVCVPEKKMINLLDTEVSSADEKRTQSHSYIFQKDAFVLTQASYKKMTTGQMYETDIDNIEIDYRNGKVIRNSWIEYGVDKVIKNKKTQKCELKTPRRDERLQLYNGFSVRDEVKCKG